MVVVMGIIQVFDPKTSLKQSTRALVAVSSASHAEGCQFDHGQVWIVFTSWNLFLTSRTRQAQKRQGLPARP